MPTYSYRCTECNTAFDIQQAFTDDSLTECPNCGGSLRKLFSAVGVSFKGSGFYRTDSRSGGGSSTVSTGSGSGSGSGSGDSGSSAPASTPAAAPAAAPAAKAPAASSSGSSGSSGSTSSAS